MTKIMPTIVSWAVLEITVVAGECVPCPGCCHRRRTASNLMLFVCIFVARCPLPYYYCLISGLAVRPNTDDSANERDSVFQLAQNATSDDAGHIKRTITMVRF